MIRLVSVFLVLISHGLSNQSAGSWSGATMVQVTICILDAESGASVPAAQIWMLTGNESEIYRIVRDRPSSGKLSKPIETFGSRVLTGPNGEASAFTYFDAQGGISWAHGEQQFDGSWIAKGDLQVEKQGYMSTDSMIETLVSEHDFTTSIRTLRVIVRLKKEPQKTPSTTTVSSAPSRG